MIVSHDWLKDYLGAKTPTPERICELFTFHAFEVEGLTKIDTDTAIDVKVLPNRGSDCLSHRGIARELATILGVDLSHDPLASLPALPATNRISVKVAAPEACSRFAALLITGVEVGQSPPWLKKRLATLGQRSINNIVDATNYVMYAIGQPLHAYDADLFPQSDGKWRFHVRYGNPTERVVLLGEGGKIEERSVECLGTELLIVDESRDLPIGLAGVKGGAYAGVHEGTKNIIVEAAHFDPPVTRRTARRLGIVIDASKRFENRPSPALPLWALSEIAKLITDIAGGTAEGVVDYYPDPYVPPTIDLSVEKVNRVLGLSLTFGTIETIMRRAGISTEAKGGDRLLCTGPIERTDLTIEEDLIEEVVRLYGFDQVRSVVPEAVALTEYCGRHHYGERIRATLLQAGFSEVITSTFRQRDELQLQNALAIDKSYVRSTLRTNLAEALDRNAGYADLLGTGDTRLFEIGNVFKRGPLGINERTMVAFGARVRVTGYSGREDAIIAETCSALESALGITIPAVLEKGVAEIDLTDLLTRLPTPTTYEVTAVTPEVAYRAFSVFPPMSRDIALWVTPEVTAPNVSETIVKAAGPLLVRITFLDEFTKDGRTSYAFRLVLQAVDRTLTDNDAVTVLEAVYEAVAKKGWEVR